MTGAAGDTIWKRGRFDARPGRSKLLFGRMYEDTAVERDAFLPGGRVFCIASAGDTALELAADHDVVAVDLNPTQLAYARRRLAGAPAERGLAERAMGFARALGPAVGWWPSLVRDFLELDDPPQQAAFWRRWLDTWRFRTGLDAFLSRPVLRLRYAGGFLGFLPVRLGPVLRERMRRCFAVHPNRTNPYARALLLGAMPENRPPPAAPVQLIEADAASFLEREDAGRFDGYTLSNILDGADAAYRQRLVDAVKRTAGPGAMVVLRSFREPDPALATNLAARDRSLLWGVVDVRRVADL